MVTGLEIGIRVVISRRADLVQEQTRRLSRLRDLLVSIHPELERVLDPTNKASLWLLTRYVTPAEIRSAGPTNLRKILAEQRAFELVTSSGWSQPA